MYKDTIEKFVKKDYTEVVAQEKTLWENTSKN